MARLYANENFPLPVVEQLRSLGHDVLTIHESGKAGQAMADEDVLAFSRSEKRMLLTFNRRHFVRLHLLQHDHCGIIACTVDSDFVGLARRIHTAIEEQSQGERPLIRINRPNR
jgi:predicted nuclease of predicted toxin-antitoxin system